jgi:AAA domain
MSDSIPDGAGSAVPQKPKAMTFGAARQRRQWLLDGFIARDTVTLVTGDKASGKSTLMTAIAASVMGGPCLPGNHRRASKGNVCWLTREESYGQDIIPRLRAAGIKGISHLRVPVSTTDKGSAADWGLPRDMDRLRQWIQSQHIALLVLDPLASWCDPPDTVYQPTLCRPLMESLIRLAGECKCTICPIVHLNKDESRSVLNRTLGAGELSNVCRSVVRVFPDATDPRVRYLASVATNLGATPKPLKWRIVSTEHSRRIEWLGTVETTTEQLAERSGDTVDRTLVSECVEWLKATLSDAADSAGRPMYPATAVKKLAEQNGFSVRTLWRAKKILGVKSRQQYNGSGEHFRVWVGPTDWPAV